MAMTDLEAPKATHHPDQPLFDTWHAYLAARDALRDLPDDDPAEARAWAVVDAAEANIRALDASTSAGVAIKLRAALVALIDDRADELVAMRGSADEIEQRNLDWPLRLIVSAMRSLETFGG